MRCPEEANRTGWVICLLSSTSRLFGKIKICLNQSQIRHSFSGVIESSSNDTVTDLIRFEFQTKAYFTVSQSIFRLKRASLLRHLILNRHFTPSFLTPSFRPDRWTRSVTFAQLDRLLASLLTFKSKTREGFWISDFSSELTSSSFTGRVDFCVPVRR